MGKLFVVAFVLVLIGVHFIVFPSNGTENNSAPINTEKPSELTQEKDQEMCIQVITPAQNPDTGAIVEFPTPCDVPEGWLPVQPEGLDLNLEVN